MKRLFLVIAAVLLAGCGGGGDSTSAMSMPDQPPAPLPPGDTFTSALVVLVRSTPETTEPVDVEGTALATPDGGEPLTVE